MRHTSFDTRKHGIHSPPSRGASRYPSIALNHLRLLPARRPVQPPRIAWQSGPALDYCPRVRRLRHRRAPSPHRMAGESSLQGTKSTRIPTAGRCRIKPPRVREKVIMSEAYSMTRLFSSMTVAGEDGHLTIQKHALAREECGGSMRTPVLFSRRSADCIHMQGLRHEERQGDEPTGVRERRCACDVPWLQQQAPHRGQVQPHASDGA